MANGDLTPEEIRYLISLLKGEAAANAARHDRHAQVKAELLISKLQRSCAT